jgi:hypothetical protein
MDWSRFWEGITPALIAFVIAALGAGGAYLSFWGGRWMRNMSESARHLAEKQAQEALDTKAMIGVKAAEQESFALVRQGFEGLAPNEKKAVALSTLKAMAPDAPDTVLDKTVEAQVYDMNNPSNYDMMPLVVEEGDETPIVTEDEDSSNG